MKLTKSNYNQLLDSIAEIYTNAKVFALREVNTILLTTYWQIGKHIVEFEQHGNLKAEYGTQLLENLAKDLSFKFGKGFSLSNVKRFRQFYIVYSKGATLSHQFKNLKKTKQKGATLSHQLTWSHYVELLKIDNDLERNFYEKQAMAENWSIRELIRQKKTSLYLRIAASKHKKDIIKLSKSNQELLKPDDILRDTYIFEFLKIPEPYHLSELDLETRLINQLQDFLLELGKGFAFVARQYRITLGNKHHHVDLVFYHRILKCFVLIDLKKDEADYKDVGQMNMYLGYFENEENTKEDNAPIGIILAKEKDELVVKYAMQNISSQLFVKKYQLYLPNEEELRKVIENELCRQE